MNFRLDLGHFTYSLAASGSLSVRGRNFRLKALSWHYGCGCVLGVGGGGAEVSGRYAALEETGCFEVPSRPISSQEVRPPSSDGAPAWLFLLRSEKGCPRPAPTTAGRSRVGFFFFFSLRELEMIVSSGRLLGGSDSC